MKKSIKYLLFCTVNKHAYRFMAFLCAKNVIANLQKNSRSICVTSNNPI